VLIWSPDGTVNSQFVIGSNLYRSDAYHANSIHYVPFDDSFTISDRNPSVFINVTAQGQLLWQLGGSCEQAPAGERCSARNWEVTHGHHLLEDGTFVAFNNTYDNASRVYEFALNVDSGLNATVTKNYTGSAYSSNLGDVQRLPGGNTLVTYSAQGKLVELDPGWEIVQTLSVRVGYSSWRPTLYGTPARP
jgi:hypothetical protein